MMSKKVFFAAVAVAGAAFGQAQLGTVSQVDGLVTLSVGQNVGVLQPGAPLVDGARIVTGNSGSTTLNFGAGCNVTVGPNQLLTLAGNKSCTDIVAAIQNLGPDQLAARGGAGFLGGNGVMLAGLTGLTGLVADDARRNVLSGE